MIVFHLVAGAFTPTGARHPRTDEVEYVQRCVRCGAELDRSYVRVHRFTPGSEVERDEQVVAGSAQPRVRYTAIPLYNINQRFKDRGLTVPRCHAVQQK